MSHEAEGLFVGQLDDPRDRIRAVSFVALGRAIGVFAGRGGLIADALKPHGLAEISRVKRAEKPRAFVMPTKEFIAKGWIDLYELDSRLRKLLEDDPEALGRYLEQAHSSIHIRYPIRLEARDKIPPGVRSSDNNENYFVQNWEPAGNPIEPLVIDIMENGGWPVITSLNLTGRLTVPKDYVAEAFCDINGLPAFMRGGGLISTEQQFAIVNGVNMKPIRGQFDLKEFFTRVKDV